MMMDAATVNIFPNVAIPTVGIEGTGADVVCTSTVSVGETLGAIQQLLNVGLS